MPRIFSARWVVARAVAAVTAAGIALVVCSAGSFAAAPQATPVKKPAYTWGAAVKSIMNPHEQINDEGDILWGTCVICHTNTPDVKTERTIKDVSLRFGEDPTEICGRCHGFKPHPVGDETSSDVRMSGLGVPNHLVVPSKMVATNMRFAQKERQMMLPLDPRSGKIICSTCHNPHEKGVLTDRADFGADAVLRLRNASVDICQNCHKK